MKPLETKMVELAKDYLPRLTYPVRTGVHPDPAFAPGQILDYARIVSDQALAELVIQRARDYYAGDADYSVGFEPSGQDFFSAGLNVADLMRRVLPAGEFREWLRRFLPEMPAALLTPAIVADRTDPKIVHLDGLNLSRAACLWSIAKALPADDPLRLTLATAAEKHATASLPHVASGDYAGEHWLASFAVWMQSAK